MSHDRLLKSPAQFQITLLICSSEPVVIRKDKYNVTNRKPVSKQQEMDMILCHMDCEKDAIFIISHPVIQLFLIQQVLQLGPLYFIFSPIRFKSFISCVKCPFPNALEFIQSRETEFVHSYIKQNFFDRAQYKIKSSFSTGVGLSPRRFQFRK